MGGGRRSGSVTAYLGQARFGVCFNDEPGIYISGELGVRHEEISFITENGAEDMTKWSGSPEEPAVI
jgi:Xaa-Pro aminopeptidase